MDSKNLITPRLPLQVNFGICFAIERWYAQLDLCHTIRVFSISVTAGAAVITEVIITAWKQLMSITNMTVVKATSGWNALGEDLVKSLTQGVLHDLLRLFLH